MRVILITQDDPYYIPEAIARLHRSLGGRHEIVGCVMAAPTAVGTRKGRVGRAIGALRLFGLRFALYYGCLAVKNRVAGRTVTGICAARAIPVLGPGIAVSSEACLRWIGDQRPDVLVSLSAAERFSASVLEIAPRGSLNVHSALLPAYRGMMPTFQVLSDGRQKTGVSVHCIEHDFDSGPVLAQHELRLRNRSHAELLRRSKRLGMRLLAGVLNDLEEGRATGLALDPALSFYRSFPTRQDVCRFRKAGGNWF